MKWRTLSSIACFALGTSANLQPLQAADTSHDPGANAALQYWRAFQYDQALDAADFSRPAYDIVSEANQGNFNEETAELFELSDFYLETLKAGTEMPYCDWGVEIWPVVLLQHLPKCKSLSHLITARFRYSMHLGHEDEAVQWLIDGFKFAEDIGDDRFIIGELIQNACEGRLIRAASEKLPDMSRSSLQRLESFLQTKALPQVRNPGNAFFNDWNFVIPHLRALLKAPNARIDDLDSRMKENLSLLTSGFQVDLTNDAHESFNRIEDFLRTVRTVLNTTAPVDLHAALEELAESAKLSTKTALIESAERFYEKSQRIVIEADLFRLAVDVALRGPGTLDTQIYVPSGSVEYLPGFRGTFDLKTSWISHGNPTPVTLSVGKLLSIHQAAQEGNDDLVIHHLEHGAEVDARDSRNWTSLHYAAANGRTTTVRLLLESGAGINLTTVPPEDSSHYQMDPKLLKRYGITLAPNREPQPAPPPSPPRGETALDLTTARNHADTSQLLKDRGAKSISELKTENAVPNP